MRHMAPICDSSAHFKYALYSEMYTLNANHALDLRGKAFLGGPALR